MVLADWQSPGAKRQIQEGVAGWPDFDPDFAEEPGLVEPYLSAIPLEAVLQARGITHYAFRTPHSALRPCASTASSR